MQITTIGLDIAKSVFQLHGIDGEGQVVLRQKVRRDKLLEMFGSIEPCLVGIEACATAHHWAREIAALGHEVRLMPPTYVKAYVKRNKNDAADAEAICEAVARPTMRFVPVKTADAQSVLLLHRSRYLLVRQRTAQVNAMRAHMAEFGIVAPKGRNHVRELAERLDGEELTLPELARQTLRLLGGMIDALSDQIRQIEVQLMSWHKANAASRRLETIPGIGFITATALSTTVTDAKVFRSGRQFAAWLGLVPRQNSSGGKERLGRISKMGDRYLRQLLVVGATAVIRFTRNKPTSLASWVNRLLDKKPARLVSVALANKLARIAWAVMVREEDYRLAPVSN
jgi:transposase